LQSHGEGKHYCFLPASNFLKFVEDRIKQSPLLLEINGKDREEFPSIHSVINYHFFTIGEVIETLKLLVADPATAYNKLCKT